MRFYGREGEIAALRTLLGRVASSEGSRMICVTGRSGSGKTAFVLKALEGSEIPVVRFVCRPCASARETAASWLQALRNACGDPSESVPASGFARPSDVFWHVMALSKERPLALFIDEDQTLFEIEPAFWSVVQHAWDIEKDRTRLFLAISCATESAFTEIFGTRAPLYARQDNQLAIRPFRTALLREIFLEESGSSSPQDLLFTFALTGGSPGLLKRLAEARALTLKAGLDYLCSPEGDWVRTEGSRLLGLEFGADAPACTKILHAAAAGAKTEHEIEAAVASSVKPYLWRLEACRLLERDYSAFDYRYWHSRFEVTDPYFRFWLRCCEPPALQALAKAQRWQELRRAVEAELPGLLDRALKDWFLRAALENGPWFEARSWWGSESEDADEDGIDFVASDTFSKRLCFADIRLEPGALDEEHLKRRAARFLKANPRFADCSQEFQRLSPADMFRSPKDEAPGKA